MSTPTGSRQLGVDRRVVRQTALGQIGESSSLPLGNELAPRGRGLPGNAKDTGDCGVGAVHAESLLGFHRCKVKQSQMEDVKLAVQSSKADETYTPEPVIQEMDDCPLKVGDLIRERRRALGLNQAQLGKLVGVTKAAISAIEKGHTMSLRGPTLVGLSNALDLPTSVLEGKRASPVKLVPMSLTGPTGPRTIKNKIAVGGTAIVDALGTWTDLKIATPALELSFESADPKAYAVRIFGDAFHPRIKSGELVVLEPSREIEPGDEVLVLLTDGRSMLRELAHHRDGQFAFNGINAHPRLTVADSEIESLHYVAAIVKPSRLIDSRD
jgi:transcriptional regulator with XRE-family HTH domain